jgi:hypothetical protein
MAHINYQLSSRRLYGLSRRPYLLRSFSDGMLYNLAGLCRGHIAPKGNLRRSRQSFANYAMRCRFVGADRTGDLCRSDPRTGASTARPCHVLLKHSPKRCGRVSKRPLLDLEIASGLLAAISDHFVIDLLAFIERAQPGSLYGGDMHEHVFASVLRLNKTKSLIRIEPLHCTACHKHSPLFGSPLRRAIPEYMPKVV